MCSERPHPAAAALERLSERTRASGTEWALAMEARSRALLTAGASAESLYDEAISRLTAGRVGFHLARAQLVYGEWLRRENRRVGARVQLAPPTIASSASGPRRSPSAPVASCSPPAKRRVSATRTRVTSFLPRRPRSRDWLDITSRKELRTPPT
jgi:hypothetical protein